MMKINWIVNDQGCLIIVWKLSTKELEEQVCDITQDDSPSRYLQKTAHAINGYIHNQCA